MSKLSAFLRQNAVQSGNMKYIASQRFLDENKKPIEWEICSITSEEDEAIRKACTRKVPVPGKRNIYTPETDYNQYLGRLAAQCTVFPNLNDAELQNSYGVMGADTLLKAMLKPGEYADYLTKIQEINGFEVTMEEMVDEAKN
ncbi:phage tail assembly chaperone [Desulforamulus ruminis]|uniref:XkdN-like protein n=1 Tax=Desulforamulus ruminis (strain ATCC 23193 / DSM 2154 / NCIMB 8452 / DL) TaxID=696281 RepID=F6DPL4_DESRL|nr:phage portal protein [Desulforamulus ruminis]AEG59591.1 XkdN-like protein [Desulforamulus ruminis DSM 2154]